MNKTNGKLIFWSTVVEYRHKQYFALYIKIKVTFRGKVTSYYVMTLTKMKQQKKKKTKKKTKKKKKKKQKTKKRHIINTQIFHYWLTVSELYFVEFALNE